MDTKIHKAELAGYSSVVGQPIMLLNIKGACIGQLSVIGAQGDYKEMVAQVAEMLNAPNRHAYRVGQAVGKSTLATDLAAALDENARLREALKGIKRAGKARMASYGDEHSYYYFTASAALGDRA